ncbi:MAG: hypothetical protein KKB31_00445, partial [Nanoarchaeota archaeon]|nr:hypothetical protein [Nanoarchaeota archaeon]
ITNIVPGYEGLPEDTSSIVRAVGQKLNISEREVYKKLEEMENDKSADKMLPDEVKILQDLNAKKYLDFMGKSVALKFMGIPENVYKDLMTAKKVLKIETTREFLNLINLLKNPSTAETLEGKQQEVFKQYAVGNYLKSIGQGQEVPKEYTGLPPDIERIISKLSRDMGIPKTDVYNKIKYLRNEETLMSLTALEKQILSKNKAGLYLRYMRKQVAPGFSGDNIVELDPIKLLRNIASELNISADKALYLIEQLGSYAKEKRLSKLEKQVLAKYEAGKWLLAEKKGVVPGYVGVDKDKEIDMIKMMATLRDKLGLEDKGILEILNNLDSKEYVSKLQPRTVRILKDANAGMYLRLQAKKPVAGFGEIIDPEKPERSYKNVIPLGSFYHKDVGWY